ncbi:ubiquitin carboxyl-terminal hydrolase 33-like isoform X3 [Homalodisca vitripennis]|uniref:ubiquitin carboxyl-terminal hydrolase 33-like isoform X3 n=1 Tax=Homalodisca vitripennis TaxID=197043 RepID=UPI001EEAE309|nr:ubiquitin carboxyl-terminal hydrolase 33-like isoform X3 [Homalodisca vitripennis]
MATRSSRCGHVASMGFISSSHVESAKDVSLQQCHSCEMRGANLWLCLHRDCLRIGCGDSGQDHSLLHFQKSPHHCVHLNLSTLRVWCYVCDVEVFLEPQSTRPTPVDFGDDDSDDSRSPVDDNNKPTGLTGLQNIGNTCYMNAALQALSNTPPLTKYFLECGAVVFGGNNGGAGGPDRKPPTLSRSYWRLMQDMWHRKRLAYVAPTGILYGIRNVHPMFRGYHQHDTQEFLRCFMDQLHEELKVPYIQPPLPHNTRQPFHVRRASSLDELSDEGEGGGASSQSEGEEYETCDSGVSERSSLSDEGSTKQAGSLSRSPTPSQDIQMSSLASHGFHSSSHLSPTRGSHRRKAQIKYRSIISDVFDGKLLSSVQCLTCNRISTRMETFQDLSLPIPSKDHLTMLHQGSVNIAKCPELYSTDQGWLTWLWEWVCSFFWGPTVGLHDCLAAFFSADELKGDNMYSCEKCNKLRNGVKYSKVLELPEVLCIHLKRFRHELMFSSKINNYVTFPLEDLDLKPYLHKDCKSKVTKYNLISVICHHGAAGSGGHYTCYSLNDQYNQWYEFDDQCVTQVRPETVRNCEAYVLFYRKVDRDICEQREQVLQLSKKALGCQEDMYVLSQAWITRFLTFTEPGPIDNTDLLCRHGQLIPGDSYSANMLTPVPASVWHHLYNIYGGGPTCAQDQLTQCTICLQESGHRPDIEYRDFARCSQSTGKLYAIAAGWFQEWEAYVKGQTLEPPGPVDNSPLLTCDSSLIVDKAYVPVTADQWALLLRIYQGGPEVVAQDSSLPVSVVEGSSESLDVKEVKLEESLNKENKRKIEDVIKEDQCLKIDGDSLKRLKRIVARRKKGKYRLTAKQTTFRKKGLEQTGALLRRCKPTGEMASHSQSPK